MYPEEENFEPTDNTMPPPSFDYLSNPPNWPLTRSLTCLLHEHHTINFFQDDFRGKFSNICEKLYKNDVHFSSLTPSEQLLWSAYDIDDFFFFLTGNQNFCLDYMFYNQISQTTLPPVPQPPVVPQPQGPWPQHLSAVDVRNIVDGPRTKKAKNLPQSLIYLQK